jgi:hypothetical protein
LQREEDEEVDDNGVETDKVSSDGSGRTEDGRNLFEASEFLKSTAPKVCASKSAPPLEV